VRGDAFAIVGAGRVGGLRDDVLIPYSPPLEDALIPSVDAVASGGRALVGA
jgi:hypothetical protein